ncbi:MAG: tRNA (N6-threonylcarbamoyladenosine(37)-N6)-methyltransferase TrmO [Firmicutes bacterium]|nr:tRNA (N6-threonylcarbamoyladenosine(37)-N6)-methyltransferase TrmO [Bacillota bacterium]
MKPIAHIHTKFIDKFGIPRQAGLADTDGYIVFEPEFAVREAVRGLEEFSHIWLIWEFSENVDKDWSPTVRPPKLGGNARKGVFATRSPFRPNPIGLSCVELTKVDFDERGPVLYVKGADILDGSPIFDIKPYVPYCDSKPDAEGSFAHKEPAKKQVAFEAEMPEPDRSTIAELLAQDPRPSYQDDPDRVYGMDYGKWQLKFVARGETLIVIDVQERK